jgi:hypothetical protein
VALLVAVALPRSLDADDIALAAPPVPPGLPVAPRPAVAVAVAE